MRPMKRSLFSSGSRSTASGRRRSTTTGSYRISETYSTFSLCNRPSPTMQVRLESSMATATKTRPDTRPAIKILPFEDRVVILPLEDSEAMRGSLYIPDTAKEKPTRGEVIAVGPGRIEKGELVPVGIRVGEVVLYGKYSGTPFQVDDEELLIVKASDILAR